MNQLVPPVVEVPRVVLVDAGVISVESGTGAGL